MLENPILTSRFNETTMEENREFRKKHPLVGCIYGCPLLLNEKYPLQSLFFVIEMNNTKNQVEGIGLIVNKAYFSSCSVYDAGNYNRYVYKGVYRLDREVIERYNEKLIFVLDEILFKGKSHSKRGSGFLQVPPKIYKREIWQELFIEEEKVEEKLKCELSRIFKTYFNKK